MATTLEARIETLPPDSSGPGPQHQRDIITTTAATYEAALAEVRARLPEGWRIVNVRTTS